MAAMRSTASPSSTTSPTRQFGLKPYRATTRRSTARCTPALGRYADPRPLAHDAALRAVAAKELSLAPGGARYVARDQYRRGGRTVGSQRRRQDDRLLHDRRARARRRRLDPAR